MSYTVVSESCTVRRSINRVIELSYVPNLVVRLGDFGNPTYRWIEDVRVQGYAIEIPMNDYYNVIAVFS